jgi:hypothetical protein
MTKKYISFRFSAGDGKGKNGLEAVLKQGIIHGSRE